MKKLILTIFLSYISLFSCANELTELETQAKAGDIKALFDLGYLYDDGDGVPQDYAKAIEYYQLAANQGSDFALNNLGSLYVNEDGVKKDLDNAKKYYISACLQRLQEACDAFDNKLDNQNL